GDNRPGQQHEGQLKQSLHLSLRVHLHQGTSAQSQLTDSGAAEGGEEYWHKTHCGVLHQNDFHGENHPGQRCVKGSGNRRRHATTYERITAVVGEFEPTSATAGYTGTEVDCRAFAADRLAAQYAEHATGKLHIPVGC